MNYLQHTLNDLFTLVNKEAVSEELQLISRNDSFVYKQKQTPATYPEHKIASILELSHVAM